MRSNYERSKFSFTFPSSFNRGGEVIFENKNYMNTRETMVQSRPSMAGTSRRLLALLFFVLSFVIQARPVNAQVAAPQCGTTLRTNRQLITESDPTITVTVTPSGLQDDNQFFLIYTGDSSLNAPFTRTSAVFSQTFTIDFNAFRTTRSPQTIHLDAAGQQFCSINLIYDSTVDQIRVGSPGSGDPATSFDLCSQAGMSRSQCDVCLSEGKIWTGVGCIPYLQQGQLVRSLISVGLGMTGGVVVLMSLYAGFLLSISQGDPKRVDEAKSAITSVIAGALFVIFSVTILRFIGVDILQLPAFG
jgi:hypothetical protein